MHSITVLRATDLIAEKCDESRPVCEREAAVCASCYSVVADRDLEKAAGKANASVYTQSPQDLLGETQNQSRFRKRRCQTPKTRMKLAMNNHRDKVSIT